MQRWLHLSMFLAAWLAAALPGRAQEHAYPSAAYTMHNPGQVYILPYPTPAGHAVAAPAATYAYGWFGVVPRRHASHHHGYYQNYHQCSQR